MLFLDRQEMPVAHRCIEAHVTERGLTEASGDVKAFTEPCGVMGKRQNDCENRKKEVTGHGPM